MQIDQNTIPEAARRIGIKPEELAAVIERGSSVSYQAGDYLFHESTPRTWLGLVLDGEVEIVRGQLGSTVLLSVLEPGAILSEGLILDDTPHATSGVARKGARIWQIPRAQLEAVREQNPRVFYRLVGQVARRLGERLRLANERSRSKAQRPPSLACAASTTRWANARCRITRTRRADAARGGELPFSGIRGTTSTLRARWPTSESRRAGKRRARRARFRRSPRRSRGRRSRRASP